VCQASFGFRFGFSYTTEKKMFIEKRLNQTQSLEPNRCSVSLGGYMTKKLRGAGLVISASLKLARRLHRLSSVGAMHEAASFWHARASARAFICTTIVLSVALLAAVDYTSEHVMPTEYWIFTIVAVAGILATWSLWWSSRFKLPFALSQKRQQQSFDALVSLTCLVGMGQLVYESFVHTGDLPGEHANEKEHGRMQDGQLNFQAMLYVTLPLVCTPAGMTIPIAKALTLLMMAFYFLLAFRVYDNISSEQACMGDDCMQEEPEEGCNGDHCMHHTDNTMQQGGHRRTSSSENSDIQAEQAIFLHDLAVHLIACFSVVAHACLSSAELSEHHVNLLHAAREADSVMNHSLKNSVAGAVTLLEVEHEDSMAVGSGASTESTERLKQAIDQLYRTMQWVSARQVLLDLASGNYQTSLSHVNAKSFLKSVASTITTSSYTINEEAEFLEVSLDEKMCRLGLDNAVANSVAHGDANKTVKFDASFKPADSGSSDTEGFIVFTVENELPEGFSTSEQNLQRAKSRAVQIASGRGVAPEKRNHTGAIFKKSGLSTNAGLRHISLACEGAHGLFDLNLGPSGNTVILTIVMPAALAKQPVSSVLMAAPARPGLMMAKRRSPTPAAAVELSAVNGRGSSIDSPPNRLSRSQVLGSASAETKVEDDGADDETENLKICVIDDSPVRAPLMLPATLLPFLM
jgi:hypothetical protein